MTTDPIKPVLKMVAPILEKMVPILPLLAEMAPNRVKALEAKGRRFATASGEHSLALCMDERRRHETARQGVFDGRAAKLLAGATA